jgi:hypothetical protein
VVTVNGSKNGAKTEKRGGFKVPDKTAMVRFEGTDYDGAEIVLRLNVSLEHYLDLRQMSEAGDQAGMAMLFGDNMLSSWNLEDDSGPIEANGDGMMFLPMEFATLIIGQWVDTVANVPAPLDQPSADLSMLAEVSTAMEDE